MFLGFPLLESDVHDASCFDYTVTRSYAEKKQSELECRISIAYMGVYTPTSSYIHMYIEAHYEESARYQYSQKSFQQASLNSLKASKT